MTAMRLQPFLHGPQPVEVHGVEPALRRAQEMAHRYGCRIDVVRKQDDALLAHAWPEGRIDLTFAGSEVA